MTKCAVCIKCSLTFALRCFFGDTQRQALAIHVLYTTHGSLLLGFPWQSFLVHLEMFLGAIWNLKMCSVHNAFMSMFAYVPFWSCSAASTGHSCFAKASAGGPLLDPTGRASSGPRVEDCLSLETRRTVLATRYQMSGCGGRCGPCPICRPPPGCPPRFPSELALCIALMLSCLVCRALAISITRVEGALVFFFLFWAPHFFLLDALSRCAGTVVLGAWMAWTSRPAPPDGLAWCLDDASRHDPASNPG